MSVDKENNINNQFESEKLQENLVFEDQNAINENNIPQNINEYQAPPIQINNNNIPQVPYDNNANADLTINPDQVQISKPLNQIQNNLPSPTPFVNDQDAQIRQLLLNLPEPYINNEFKEPMAQNYINNNQQINQQVNRNNPNQFRRINNGDGCETETTIFVVVVSCCCLCIIYVFYLFISFLEKLGDALRNLD